MSVLCNFQADCLRRQAGLCCLETKSTVICTLWPQTPLGARYILEVHCKKTCNLRNYIATSKDVSVSQGLEWMNTGWGRAHSIILAQNKMETATKYRPDSSASTVVSYSRGRSDKISLGLMDDPSYLQAMWSDAQILSMSSRPDIICPLPASAASLGTTLFLSLYSSH